MKEVLIEYVNGISAIILATVASYLAYRHNKLTRELSNDNLQKQLFTEFNARYDKLNDIIQFILELSEEDIIKYKKGKGEDKFGDYTKSYIKFKINDYFNLCSEEYYWYSKERIDNRIWNAWEKGMKDIYNNSEIIRDQWIEEIKNEGWKSFYLKSPTDIFNIKRHEIKG
ncbi:hypothetical protein OOZ35_12960 [Mesoflavibacter profundi]|uniref:DUF4760 domain-containing protein n=1 Tax=Mesoflavibacter profundi TaxID=2708110 RepID=A0ABT4S2V4_9FLAO|nr:hypothetical protein [Mesoflavibacter profundi]MDA0178404.1 hypothetical protein [Mesoflavibacter profundi]